MKQVPPRRPAQPPAWDPNDARYWDERDLEGELLRTYHICADCRMCVTYCGAFPILFDKVDHDVEAGRAHSVELVDPETIAKVTDHCWQCKLCYIKCPYTADDGSYELLDFPRLMAREKAVRARRNGVALVDRVLGEPQLIGMLGAGPPAPMANLVNKQRLLRKVLEKVSGISAEFPLPPLARHRFSAWADSHTPLENAGEQGEVVLFPTCYGEHNFPDVPRAATLVLENNGYSVIVPGGPGCCGMPNLDGGDVDAAKQKMAGYVDVLLPLVRRGLKLVVPGPTCGYTIKKEWPLYLGTPEAKEVAAATLDLMEFLDGLRREKKLVKNFHKGFGKVAYHAACHLRAQKIAIPGARVLSQLPDTEVRIIERCSAVDGTWGMKAAYYEEGARYGGRLGKAIEERPGEARRGGRGTEPPTRNSDEEIVVGDCNLAGLRVLKSTGLRMLHPVEALAQAYGLIEEA